MGTSKAHEEESAGGVVFRMEHGRPLFLLIRDSYHNWGFPKGHLEDGEPASQAALREVAEETGIRSLQLRAPISTIDWYFRFRGRLVHKVCHFFLIESGDARTRPQREEGITACHWLPQAEALGRISYANARAVLERAAALVAVGEWPAGNEGGTGAARDGERIE